MRRKILLFTFVLALALAPLNGALAQEGEGPWCGELAQADCDMLIANAKAMAELWSYTYDTEMTYGMTIEDEPMEIVFTSDGTLAYDKEEVDAVVNEVLDMTLRQVLELTKDPKALWTTGLGYAERVLKAPSADVNLKLVLPAEMVGGSPFTADINLVMVDGVLYGKSFLLAMMGLEADQWVSVDLVGGMYQIAEALQDPALLENLMSGISGKSSGMPMAAPSAEMPGVEMPMGGGAGQDIMAKIQELISAPYWKTMDSPEFKTKTVLVTRLEDAEAGGVAVAVFETKVDMAAMAATEEFQQAFKDIFAVTGAGLSPEQIDAMVPVLLDMLNSMEITLTKMIGLEDHFTYGYEASWSLAVDTKAIVGAIVEEEMSEEAMEALTPQAYDFNVKTTFSGHNQEPDVSPPDAEKVVPIQKLIEMMSQPPETTK
ncbi:MAG: hypothetical protein JXB47_05175 [Anaerolineae bacterium]|nr:hypothetical protein [Anaerolineae bacterium]